MQSNPTSQPVPIRTPASNTNHDKQRLVPLAIRASGSPPTGSRLPENIMRLQPGHPFKLVNGVPLFEVKDPVFEVREAAAILGISKDLLDKWRDRGQGPEFIQYYGRGGAVRYRLSALEAFKATHTVRPSRQPRTRKVRQ